MAVSAYPARRPAYWRNNMELKIGSTEKVSFSLFKKRFLFESANRGLVLEQADGVVCLYATDAAHSKILCAMPMGRIRDMKGANYYIFAPDEDKLLAAVGRALFVVDFTEQWGAANLENYRIYGSDHWGQDCQKPWQGSFMKLFGLPDMDAAMDKAAAEAFWAWFGENEEKIIEKLSGAGASQVIEWVDEKICPIFPYVPADAVQFELGWNNGVGEFFFFHNGNERLGSDGETFASMMPEHMKTRWTVKVQT